MTAKQTSPARTKKASALKRTLFTLLFLSFMGWLFLMGWALFIWVSQDFESAYRWVNHLVIKQSDLMLWPIIQPRHEIIEVRGSGIPLLNEAKHHADLLWLLVQTSSHVMLTKLATLITALPLFFLAIMAGLIDGLNQRAIRAACLGRESTYVFHKSVPFAHKGMCWVLGLWLCVPVEFSPTPLFVGLAVMLALVTRISVSRFKKYL